MATKSRATKRRLPWYLRPFKWLLWFILISIAWVLVYAVVPPPVTFTMLADSSGITKDWTGLSRIDRTMVRAVIAAEDGKYCSHNGFEADALAIGRATCRERVCKYVENSVVAGSVNKN